MELKHTVRFPVSRIDQLQEKRSRQRWLIDSLWTHEAVGILGGAPKCCKSWLGLDMAISVASGTPCLGRFAACHPGTVLIYLAEDTLADVRTRCEAICTHRSISLNQLDLFTITATSLRLDKNEDQKRLHATIAHIKPRLLLLDPLVRLHRLDENSSADISRILGFLRELQREHALAIILVHHASKRQHAQPGQALRGSSDLHAFGDSNVYLARRQERLVLTLEHRSAKPIDPLQIELISDPSRNYAHLEVVSAVLENSTESLNGQVRKLLKNSLSPLRRTKIRSLLKVNNQRLGHALLELEEQRVIIRCPEGWMISQNGARQEIFSESTAESGVFVHRPA
jgi:hypothetical protein